MEAVNESPFVTYYPERKPLRPNRHQALWPNSCYVSVLVVLAVFRVRSNVLSDVVLPLLKNHAVKW